MSICIKTAQKPPFRAERAKKFFDRKIDPRLKIFDPPPDKISGGGQPRAGEKVIFYLANVYELYISTYCIAIGDHLQPRRHHMHVRHTLLHQLRDFNDTLSMLVHSFRYRSFGHHVLSCKAGVEPYVCVGRLFRTW